MADTTTTKKVTALTENTAPADTDLFMIGNSGTASLRKIKWSNLLTAIKTKIASWTFGNLGTTDKTLPGAINELNTKIISVEEINLFGEKSNVTKNTNTILGQHSLKKGYYVGYLWIRHQGGSAATWWTKNGVLENSSNPGDDFVATIGGSWQTNTLPIRLILNTDATVYVWHMHESAEAHTCDYRIKLMRLVKS
ncbi:MAG: hypothetical protein PHR92_10170 [Lachnospiraceae bacterium]|nr:hypothetical protein [Lachnospiraceae bacterium]